MDLAGRALEVTPWRPGAYERARTTLRAAMAGPGSLTEAAPVPETAPLRRRGSSPAGHRRRRTLGTRGKVSIGIGIGAGVGAIAAAAALVLAAAAPQPAIPASQPATPAGPASRPSGPPTGSAGARQPLVTLAAYLAAEPAPKGDATLVERETGAARVTVWDLYADDGRYFFSQTEAGLPAQVKENNSQGGGWTGREAAAAIYAVKGNLDTAKLKMAWPYATPAPTFYAQVEDGDVWENCENVLVAGSGNPQVRAGVLRLVSALPGITVTHGTLDGQPTLTLADKDLGYTGPKNGPKAKGETSYEEAITINAGTGIPLQVATGPVGNVTTGVRYVVTRVTLADIAAGKLPPALPASDPRPDRTRCRPSPGLPRPTTTTTSPSPITCATPTSSPTAPAWPASGPCSPTCPPTCSPGPGKATSPSRPPTTASSSASEPAHARPGHRTTVPFGS